MNLFLKGILLLTLTLGISSGLSAKTYKMAVTDIEGMDALISEWGPFKEAL
ncbi:MAG: phosphonate ABC transporter substrate-binding protein, partial [Rhodobacteraceae bacterium]|nr:phosphonate ABC transporter substrate-binding protein [Paracoccaceae bacterium]